MKNIYHILLFLLTIQIYGQQSSVAAGNDFIGSNGNISYSVGQIVYTTVLENSGSIAQGVQQPFELNTLSTIKKPLKLDISIYPNPTQDIVTLILPNSNTQNFYYQLFDIRGRLLKTMKIVNTETEIDMTNLEKATYLLYLKNKRSHNNQIIKIIKN